MSALVPLLIPIAGQPNQDRLTPFEGTYNGLSHHVRCPDGIVGEAITQDIFAALVESPAIPMDAVDHLLVDEGGCNHGLSG